MAKRPAAKKKPAARRAAAPKRVTKPAARSKRPGKKKAPARKAAPPPRKAAKKSRKSPAAKAVKARKATTASRKVTPKKAAARKPVARKPVVKKAAATPARKAAPKPVAKRAVAPKATPARHVPALDRARRTVADTTPGTPSSFVSNRHASAASSGADELRVKLATHTGTGPAITAGDVDANWEAAETVGDEAPGGDNPTPDQDVVDEIGKALGVEYDDDEELQGGDEIAARDHDRWELDPASSDDFDER